MHVFAVLPAESAKDDEPYNVLRERTDTHTQENATHKEEETKRYRFDFFQLVEGKGNTVCVCFCLLPHALWFSFSLPLLAPNRKLVIRDVIVICYLFCISLSLAVVAVVVVVVE